MRRVPGPFAAVRLLVAAGAAVAIAACDKPPSSHVLVSRRAPDGSLVATARIEPCGAAWCETLAVGPPGGGATILATLQADRDRCDEIAWARDGTRVAFLINGHRLRLYDARTHAPAGLVDLVPADGPPTTRVARGLTFSDNGAAITFDDCPRASSGCRPGLVALR